ncbi:MAG: biotin/lipoyl-binding protein [Clostridia bacterium]
MKRHMAKIKILLVLTAFSLLLSGCMYFYPSEIREYIPDLVPSKRLVIPSVSVRMGTIRVSYSLQGVFTVDKPQSSDIESKISGTIEEIYVFKGQLVEAGNLLAKINTDSIEEQIFLAEIDLEKTLIQYRNTLNRFHAGLVDSFEMDLMEINRQRRVNQLQDLREREKLHYLYAPASGTVYDIYKARGSSSVGLIMTICEKDDGVAEMIIRIPNDNYVMTKTEVELASLKPGREVVIEYNGEEYPAKILRDNFLYVSQVSLVPGQNIFIHARFDQVPHSINFGNRVVLRYLEAEAEDVLVIPASCVFSEAGMQYTYLVENGEIIRREIETGVSDGSFYEVISGVSLGEKLLLNR